MLFSHWNRLIAFGKFTVVIFLLFNVLVSHCWCDDQIILLNPLFTFVSSINVSYLCIIRLSQIILITLPSVQES